MESAPKGSIPTHSPFGCNFVKRYVFAYSKEALLYFDRMCKRQRSASGTLEVRGIWLPRLVFALRFLR